MPRVKTATALTVPKEFVITLRRSPIGTPQKHRLVLSGLGLRKIRQRVTRPNTSQVRGMIGKVGYLLEVQPQ